MFSENLKKVLSDNKKWLIISSLLIASTTLIGVGLFNNANKTSFIAGVVGFAILLGLTLWNTVGIANDIKFELEELNVDGMANEQYQKI